MSGNSSNNPLCQKNHQSARTDPLAFPPVSKYFNAHIPLTGILAMVVVSITIWSYISVQHSIRSDVTKTLTTLLNSEKTALEQWFNNQKNTVMSWATNDQVIKATRNQIYFSQEVSMSREDLLSSTHIKTLRTILEPVCKLHNFIGFVIVDKQGNNIAALLDDPLGTQNLVNRLSFVKEALAGGSVVTKPFASSIPLPNHGDVYKKRPTMFSGAPITDENGDVVAGLFFRIRPEAAFSKIFVIARVGKTGETYAFDEQGLMLTQSRFNEQLKEIGLIENLPDSNSILQIQIKDPGGNMLDGFEPKTKRESLSPTKMATAAMNHLDGVDVIGYRDYRGVSVVGAWSWMEDYGMGVATEIDSDEAYAVLVLLRKVIFLLASFLTIVSVGVVILGNRKKKKKTALKETENRLSTIISSLVEALIVIDDKGIVQSINRAGENFFGYTPSEIIGKNINIIVPEPHHGLHDKYIQDYLSTGQPKIIGIGRELTGLRKNKTTFPLYLTISQIETSTGINFIGVVRDISDKEKAVMEIKKAREDAERSNKAKSTFLTHMSHELRTPLNAITGFSELLITNSNNLTDIQKQDLKAIYSSGKHLVTLINEILDLSGIETGEINLSMEPVSIGQLFDEIHCYTLPLADKKGIEIIDKTSKFHRKFVTADKTRLKQVLINLASNGIKYNKNGGSLTYSIQEIDNDRLRVIFTDTGIGIDNNKFKLLFEPFNRLGVEIETSEEGTGIGLCIAKQLIELMNGKIGVESSLGEGSVFFIELPLTQAEVIPEDIFDRQLPVQLVAGEDNPVYVLYVEDNQVNVDLVTRILSSMPNINLITVSEAQTGIDTALSQHLDLILMDIHLPGMNGIEALGILKQDPKTCNIPVVAISANAMANDIEKALKLGFEDYIVKPIDVLDFNRTITKILNL